MHVAIESVGTTRGGGWVILNEVLQALCEDSNFTRITVFGSPQSIYAEARFLHPKVDWKKRTAASRLYPLRMHWLTHGLNEECQRIGAQVVLQMNAVGLTDLPTISYVQQPLFFDERARKTLSLSHQARLLVLEKLAKKSCRESDKVFVQTEWMRQAMQKSWKLKPTILRSPPPKIERMFATTRKEQLLWIGSELPYKRRQYFDRLVDDFPATQFRALCSSDAAKSRDEVLEIIRASSIIVITSLTESLGLPLIEAMAKGTMIVAPDLPYAKEICGEGALYYEYDSFESFLSKVGLAMEDNTLRAQHIQAGTRRALALEKESENYLLLRDALREFSK